MNSDTICALATAPGGALGIIRVSGPMAFDAVQAIADKDVNKFSPNSAHFVRLTAKNTQKSKQCSEQPVSMPNQETLDEAMVTVFHAPHSYTGEDSVEISCHGSRYILKNSTSHRQKP